MGFALGPRSFFEVLVMTLGLPATFGNFMWYRVCLEAATTADEASHLGHLQQHLPKRLMYVWHYLLLKVSRCNRAFGCGMLTVKQVHASLSRENSHLCNQRRMFTYLATTMHSSFRQGGFVALTAFRSLKQAHSESPYRN